MRVRFCRLGRSASDGGIEFLHLALNATESKVVVDQVRVDPGYQGIRVVVKRLLHIPVAGIGIVRESSNRVDEASVG